MAKDEGVQRQIYVNQRGLDEISKIIRDLPEKVAGRRVLVGMKRALKKPRDLARDAVEPVSGALRKSIHVVNGRRSREGNPYVVLRVNPRTKVQYQNPITGEMITREPKNYLHWILGGVEAGPRKSERGFVVYDWESGQPMRIKTIQHPGYDGRDIFGDAWDKTLPIVLSTTFGEIQKSVKQYKRQKGLL